MIENKMSLDALRMLLFNVSNQEMTVRELRSVLFNASLSKIKWSESDLSLAIKDITKDGE